MDPFSSSVPRTQSVASSSSPNYRLPLLLLLLVLLAAVAFLPTYLEQLKYRQTKGEVAALSEALPDLKIGSLGNLFTLIARKVSPSVVHIDTDRQVRLQADEITAFLDPQIRQQRGQASGVIVDEEGYIVTNYHVIARADEVRVRLPDGRTRMAEVIGTDAKNDLAVIKIEAEGLIPAPWGDSDQIQVGAMVWAIGNPFGLDNSLTFGIVSAKDRRGLNEDFLYNEYLQTDAAVNPGNSGGPLVNMTGEIVGINTAIVGPTYQGISFAIPSNVAQRIYRQIRDTGGDVVNGYLGVELLPINELLAERLGIEYAPGALVARVSPGSPADKAGVRPKDLIVAWNGETIADAQQLFHFMSRTAPGTKGNLTVLREGREIEIEVTVGRRPWQN